MLIFLIVFNSFQCYFAFEERIGEDIAVQICKISVIISPTKNLFLVCQSNAIINTSDSQQIYLLRFDAKIVNTGLCTDDCLYKKIGMYF